MEAIIFCGLQGSGKSTFYKERFFNTHIRINLDMLRTRNRERILLEACIAMKQPFVVDNTNPTVESRASYITQARAAGFRVIGYSFSADINEAVARNARRTAKARVPVAAIFGTAKKLQAPTLAEGFNELYVVQSGEDGVFIVTVWGDA